MYDEKLLYPRLGEIYRHHLVRPAVRMSVQLILFGPYLSLRGTLEFVTCFTSYKDWASSRLLKGKVRNSCPVHIFLY